MTFKALSHSHMVDIVSDRRQLMTVFFSKLKNMQISKPVTKLVSDIEGEDRNELKRHIFSRSVDRVAVKRLVKRIFEPCKCRQRQVTQELTVSS